MKDFQHQADIIDQSWDKPAWALFMDTGTGKSRVAIRTAEELWHEKKIDAMLIIAPAGTYRNWTDVEIPKHLEFMAWHLDVWKSSASQKSKKEMIVRAQNRSAFIDILAINVEAFSHPKSEAVKLAETFLKSHRCLMVIDESTQIKVPSSTKTKTVQRLAGLAHYRRILSGMPVTESPENLYTQLRCLGSPLFQYNSFYGFRNRFCSLEEKTIRSGGHLRKFSVVTGARREKELNDLIKSFGTIIHKSECLDLPPKVYQRRTVEMSKEQARAYAEMKKSAAIEIMGQEVTALNVLGILEKQHQIVCGFLKNGDNVVWFDDSRINALMEQLEETQGKVVIWTHYKAAIRRIVEAISKKYGTQAVASFSGDTSSDERPVLMRNFQDPSHSLRFLVANPTTGKFSWTLTTASTAIYFSNSYKLEDRYQSEDRLHRIGQTSKVTYIDLVTPDTVDEQILLALREKRNIAAEIMQWRELLAA